MKTINALSRARQQTNPVTGRRSGAAVYKRTAGSRRLTSLVRSLTAPTVRPCARCRRWANHGELADGQERDRELRGAGSRRGGDQRAGSGPGGGEEEEEGAGSSRADQRRRQRQRHWQAAAEHHRQEELQVPWSQQVTGTRNPHVCLRSSLGLETKKTGEITREHHLVLQAPMDRSF